MERRKYIQYADERNTIIWFYRGNIEDHENYVFGHKLGNNIYWDMKRVPKNIFNELLSASNKIINTNILVIVTIMVEI